MPALVSNVAVEMTLTVEFGIVPLAHPVRRKTPADGSFTLDKKGILSAYSLKRMLRSL